MTFADLRAGDSIFIDANTWVYHFTAHATFGSSCTALVRKIEHQTIVGFSSTDVLTEVAHRLMLIEASTLQGWPLAGTLKRLQKDLAVVHKLTQFRTALDELLRTGVRML